MSSITFASLGLWVVATLCLSGCGDSAAEPEGSSSGSMSNTAGATGAAAQVGGSNAGPGSAGVAGTGDPSAGDPNASCAVPPDAAAEDSSTPTHVIGDGTPASCSSEAVVAAVRQGGIITFDCGPDPITITMQETAKIKNDTGPKIVLDGGGKVTLSGGGQRRILYMNTCDGDQVWTTDHCDNQDHPQLTLQNISFVEGNSKGETSYDGGGAVWIRGGRFKLVNTRFFGNVCADTGQDVGGGAVRVFSQFDGKPVYVVSSTFGSLEAGNVCSNAGGISSIGVSWTILNSVFEGNKAIGWGMNPAAPGTPGGGLGAAIYNDGNEMTLSLCGTTIRGNEAKELGGAVFFVSNNLTGAVRIDRSKIEENPGKDYQKYKGLYIEATDKQGNGGIDITNTSIAEKD